jgi:intracellular sulfur oxidation DsrE/DsrF family protein
MRRRHIFGALLAAAGGLIGARGARAADDPGVTKVVYHLCDLDKAAFVLGNIRNHYEGTDGAAVIALVVHGPALAAFKAKAASGLVAADLAGLAKRGLVAHACANTLRGMDLTLGDLLPGFAVAERGGVVKLAQLQREGFVYLRP